MHFPVNLDITNRLCVVVGGGKVALRKVRALVDCNTQVIVISPEVVVGIADLAEAGQIDLNRKRYAYGDLEGAFLVFSTTDNPAVQEMVSREAKERNILLNSADDPARCDFQVPAKVRRGTLLLTIATGGASPALSRRIRLELEELYGEEYALVTGLFAHVRKVVVAGSRASSENKKLFEKMLFSGIVESVKGKNWHQVRQILQKSLPSEIDVDAITDKIVDQHQQSILDEDAQKPL